MRSHCSYTSFRIRSRIHENENRANAYITYDYIRSLYVADAYCKHLSLALALCGLNSLTKFRQVGLGGIGFTFKSALSNTKAPKMLSLNDLPRSLGQRGCRLRQRQRRWRRPTASIEQRASES